jgi:hypothetical protein
MLQQPVQFVLRKFYWKEILLNSSKEFSIGQRYKNTSVFSLALYVYFSLTNYTYVLLFGFSL